jgi:hypothetical protein
VTELVDRLEALAHGVLGPLVLGGPMHLVPPVGPEIAMQLGADGRRIVDDALRTAVDVARVRQARRVAPVDVLPDLSAYEWAMVAALNDLMQATNHELSGALTRSRHEKLVAATERLLEAIPPPRTTIEAIVRHATFARMGEVRRVDTTVRYWIGTQSFRGQKPPSRLLAWKGLRRVDVDETEVRLGAMPAGLAALDGGAWGAALAHLYSRSPLTDLATADRTAPEFGWSPATIALVSYPIGRTLARRAVRGVGGAVRERLIAAAARAPAGAHAVIEEFLAELEGRAKAG